MKLSIFLVALILFELTTSIHCQCLFSSATDAGNDDNNDRSFSRSKSVSKLTCSYFTNNFQAYSNEYENTTYVRLQSDFTEIRIDSTKYTKLSSFVLECEPLVNTLNMSYLSNLTSLSSLEIPLNNYKTINSNLNNESNTFEKLETFETIGAKNILGSYSYFLNLKQLHLNFYKIQCFDITSLPNSLIFFRITSDRDTALVNQISLKKLSNLFELFLPYNPYRPNAELISSSEKVLRTVNLYNQKFLVDTNLTKLHMKNSETPLKYIPTNLRVLSLYNSDLNVACEQLKQSKVEELLIVNNKRSLDSFDMSCLPLNVTWLALQYNRIQNVNLKPLISLPHIRHIDLTGNPINCTCETFRDVYQILSKQSTLEILIDCEPNSVLTGYPLKYDYWSTFATVREILLKKLLKHDLDNMKCSSSEMTTAQP